MGLESNGQTKRVIAPGAEKWLGVTQEVLGSGEIELVDYMGTEEQMVGIARISHGSILPHTNPVQAQRLINYFVENRHTSPLEFIELTFRWKLPIFVARQVVRHRTANINEQSARHSELGADLFIPELNRVQGQSKDNKQGSVTSKDLVREHGSEGGLSDEVRQGFIDALTEIERNAKIFYQESLGKGIAKEIARIHLPVGTYTNWVWKLDLHNLFHFIGLRMDPHAQYEVQVYAEAMWKVMKDAYPMCCTAFEEYKLHSKTFSRSEMKTLKGILAQYLLENPRDKEFPEMKKIFEKVGL